MPRMIPESEMALQLHRCGMYGTGKQRGKCFFRYFVRFQLDTAHKRWYNDSRFGKETAKNTKRYGRCCG